MSFKLTGSRRLCGLLLVAKAEEGSALGAIAWSTMQPRAGLEALMTPRADV